MPKSTYTQNRYAVCVGINQYRPSAGLSALRYAESDARAVDALLGQLGFETENRCLLTGEDATLEAVNAALSTMILDKPQENDLVFFYFAGHSLPLVINQREVDTGAAPRSEVFLTTYDFDRGKIRESLAFRKQRALGMERLRREFFEGEGSRKRLFLFDSCYSGDFYGPGYRDDETPDPVQSYIKRMLESTSAGRVALSSCLPIQKAAEDPALGHGRFTHHLLEALSGEAVEALGRDGCLTVNSLFDYLARRLPADQRPVLSGVQQDTFELVCYPDKVESPHAPHLVSEEMRRMEKERGLRALLADHQGFLHDRLGSFVGRKMELAELRRYIAETMQAGGYVAITGQAGQGKSSIIAKLIEEYEPEKVAFHFIPFNPGPDHQVGLLRNLMARLILKYELSDLYVVSESRPVLRDFLPKVLADLVAKSGQEAIFIDGLDQLDEEPGGFRDLSFLPTSPPPGIVFVLGTRPNDTLRPLELLKPLYEYKLPNLSRQDFDRILEHRQAHLDKALADQFYQAMGENALYLDLVAKELVTARTTSPTDIISKIANNPENLFSLSIERLRRPRSEWSEVIKPLLGLLLAAREPLAKRHLKQILKVDAERLNEGLERLGGLVADDGQQRYTLYHLKLRDYLRQDETNLDKKYVFDAEEEEAWHATLANWCEQNDLSSIWADVKQNALEQGRREYARHHYVTHLYRAKERQRLFTVLDAGQYGQAKVRHDPGTRSYTQDLDLGRQAAAWEGWSMEEGIALLPRLWRYTLLRCSLTSRANQYPLAAFQMLLALKRETEALGLAELLSDPGKKSRVLLHIAKYLNEQPGRKPESAQMLMRAYKTACMIQVVSFEESGIFLELVAASIQAQQWEQAKVVISSLYEGQEKVGALCVLGAALFRAEQWERAEATWDEAEAQACMIEEDDRRAGALRELGGALIKTGQWERAEAVIRAIKESQQRAKASRDKGASLTQQQGWGQEQEWGLPQRWGQPQGWGQLRVSHPEIAALHELGTAHSQAGQWERAKGLWNETEMMIHTIANDDERAEASRELGGALIQAGQWERAEAVIRAIEESRQRGEALLELEGALIKTGQWERAEALIRAIEQIDHRVKALCELGVALSEVGQQEQAKRIWGQAEAMFHTTTNDYDRVLALRELGVALIQARQWERARTVIRTIEQSSEKAWALCELGAGLVQAGQRRRAKLVWAEATLVAYMMVEGSREKANVLRELGVALAQAEEWERAEAVWGEAQVAAHEIGESASRLEALCELGEALTQARQWERAETIWDEAEAVISDGREQNGDWPLRMLGRALVQAQQWERVEAVISRIKSFLRALESNGRVEAVYEVGRALIQAQQWEHAEAIISMAEGSKQRTSLARELGAGLIQAQQWERAEAVVSTIEDSSQRVEALCELGMTLVKLQQWERAVAVWSKAQAMIGSEERNDEASIKNPNAWLGKKDWGLRDLGMALAKLQQWERAEAVIRTIEQNGEKAEALYELGAALAQTQQREHAEAIWGEAAALKIERSLWGTRTLRRIGVALAQAGQWERAEAVIRTIEQSGEKAEALCELDAALAQTQQREHAEAIWDEAEATALSVEESRERADALREVGVILARAQQWKRADAVIHLIEQSVIRVGSRVKVRALREVGAVSVKAQQWGIARVVWGEARAEVDRIEDFNARARELHELRSDLTEALCELGVVLTQGQQWEQAEAVWEQAEAVARTMEESREEVRALYEVSMALIKSQQWERAEAVISTIEQSDEKASALCALRIALAHARQGEQTEAILREAEAAARTIERSDEKARALCELGTALAQAQQWQQAEAILREAEVVEGAIRGIGRSVAMRTWCMALARAKRWTEAEAVISMLEERGSEAGALLGLATVLATASEHERLLRLVQRSWTRVDSRDLAIYLFPLVHGLLILQPEIGVSLSEVFLWVDTFLQDEKTDA